jgi:predicted acylesterase/phospholipase RssA
MQRNILYIASPQQLEDSRKSLIRLGSKVSDIESTGDNKDETYFVEHQNLDPLKLNIQVINVGDSIIDVLTLKDIDLIIYDERGEEVPGAIIAIEELRKQVQQHTRKWGPDFNFPMRRCIAILKDTDDAAHRAFILGRDHVKDVIVDPHSMVKVLAKIADIIAADIQVSIENKIGVALSGGALEGFLYQLGAAHALDQALLEKTTRDFDVYSGVSSGSIISSLLACDVDPYEIIKSLHGTSEHLPHLKSKTIFDFATKDVSSRIFKASKQWTGLDASKMVSNFLKAIPTGFFKGAGLKSYFETCLEVFDKSNYFHKLRPTLFVGATDQDTLEHVVFHKDQEIQPTISEAVKASCALPPFYTPEKIGSRRYIDGQVTRTSNLAKVVNEGCRLVFIIDPLKPFATNVPGAVDKEGGIFALIQTVKALVYSRFSSTLSHMTERFPDVDFIVLQPDEETTRKMSGSPMRYKIRTEIIDLAYKSTLKKLVSRHNLYKTKLEKHDIKLKDISELEKLERAGIEV